MTNAELAGRLTPAHLDDLARRLAFRPDDRADLVTAAASLSDDDLTRISAAAQRLVSRIGTFDWPEPAFADLPDEPGRPMGLLPMMTLLATVPDVGAFHAARGIGTADSLAALSDLGQQVFVHRLTFGAFGLHTHEWLPRAWSGSLYWLGRLQFNLERFEGIGTNGEWVWSTHIPQSGPLSPRAVDESFSSAVTFFSIHFPDFPVDSFHCHSWLLDPRLAALLPDSNLAHFQRRWSLVGEPTPGDADVFFFIWHRRGAVDPVTLPRSTRLCRTVLDAIDHGRHWECWNGLIDTRAAASG